jgi:hypothetical protein
MPKSNDRFDMASPDLPTLRSHIFTLWSQGGHWRIKINMAVPFLVYAILSTVNYSFAFISRDLPNSG